MTSDALLEADRAWSRTAANSTDVDEIIGIWTDDAVIYPPGQPAIQGKAAIRQFIAKMHAMPGFSVSWTPLAGEVANSGDFGFTTGTNRFIVPDGTGKLSTFNGRYFTVWRLGTDNTWRCSVDAWHEAPAEPK